MFYCPSLSWTPACRVSRPWRTSLVASVVRSRFGIPLPTLQSWGRGTWSHNHSFYPESSTWKKKNAADHFDSISRSFMDFSRSHLLSDVRQKTQFDDYHQKVRNVISWFLFHLFLGSPSVFKPFCVCVCVCVSTGCSQEPQFCQGSRLLPNGPILRPKFEIAPLNFTFSSLRPFFFLALRIWLVKVSQRDEFHEPQILQSIPATCGEHRICR